jgi:hypothetical protein
MWAWQPAAGPEWPAEREGRYRDFLSMKKYGRPFFRFMVSKLLQNILIH